MRVPRVHKLLLKTVISTYREEHTSTTDTGVAITTYRTILSDVRVHLQASDAQMEYELRGKVHIQTHECIFDRFLGGILREVKAGDILYDHNTGQKHIIVGVNQESSKPDDGYYILALTFIDNDDRFATVTRREIKSKARVKTDPGVSKTIDVKARVNAAS